jgi:hypothetical protein
MAPFSRPEASRISVFRWLAAALSMLCGPAFGCPATGTPVIKIVPSGKGMVRVFDEEGNAREETAPVLTPASDAKILACKEAGDARRTRLYQVSYDGKVAWIAAIHVQIDLRSASEARPCEANAAASDPRTSFTSNGVGCRVTVQPQ